MKDISHVLVAGAYILITTGVIDGQIGHHSVCPEVKPVCYGQLEDIVYGPVGFSLKRAFISSWQVDSARRRRS